MYREATNRHDNDYHDKATDSIVNYEVSVDIFCFCWMCAFISYMNSDREVL